jgi:hypothetical protein
MRGFLFFVYSISSMYGKFFGNQNSEQVLKHLSNLLDKGVYYNLSVDPLGIVFSIKESVRGPRPKRDEEENLERLGKIRRRKKGRTVNLKGRVY